MLVQIQDDMMELERLGLLRKLLADKTTKGHILWGTDAYQDRGEAYGKGREMQVPLFLYENMGVITARARKAMEQQSSRTKQHGEVFTPRWVCDEMVDAIDADFFGVEKLPADAWQDMLTLFEETKRSWKKYVDNKRLEITCGEGPYLTERYDVSTGEMISLPQRRGIVDRKLLVISYFAKDRDEWIYWALRAAEASYGYEFQGDNLLIARVNVMKTFAEHYAHRWEEAPPLSLLRRLVNKVVWNLWQMDGLTQRLPCCTEDQEGENLFAYADMDISSILAENQPHTQVYFWRKKKHIPFEQLKERDGNMKFDYIIGNPPYQEDTAESTRKRPIYNRFMDEAYGISNRVLLITPARFLFDAGQTPKTWNRQMLSDPHLKVLEYETDATKIFPNTDIKGGVAITFRNRNKNFGAIGTFTKFPILNKILNCVKSHGYESIQSIVSVRGNYRFSTEFFSKFPRAEEQIKSGTGNMIVSNIFNKLPEAFADSCDDDTCIKIIGRENNKRTFKYLNKDYVIENPYIQTYNVLISEANNTGKFGETLVEPQILMPNEGATDTFISIGFFHEKSTAINASKYIKTKFCRAMLGIKKATQHTAQSVWEFVPLQDFTNESDIDWSKSIAEIDQQLYKKYGLSQEEVDFIEKNVKEMK